MNSKSLLYSRITMYKLAKLRVQIHIGKSGCGRRFAALGLMS